MMKAIRLDSIGFSMSELFWRASESQRRKAVLIACEYAVNSVGLSDNCIISRAISVLYRMSTPDSSLSHQLEDFATSLDGEYFGLSEESGQFQNDDVLRIFSKARAVYAVMFALSVDSFQLHEAIYEAVIAIADPSELICIVNDELTL